MRYIVWIYIIVINVTGFLAMGIDKQKARRNAWRISEKTFFVISFLGGGAGTWLGMYTFRHKTKHWYFVIFIPAIFLLELILFLHFDIYLHIAL